MITKTKKMVLLLLILALFLSACGVQGPEKIEWSSVETTTEFGEVEIEIPWDQLIREENLVNCEQEQILAYECFGDMYNGYKCIDDSCYIFYNSKMYKMDETVAEKYKERVLGAYVASRESDNTALQVGGLVLMGIGVFASGLIGWIIGGAGFIIAAVSTGNELSDDVYEKYGRNGGANYKKIDEIELSPYEIVR